MWEKATLCSGLNVRDTKPIDRLGIPSANLYDGPNGLRRTINEGVSDSQENYKSRASTCFPTSSAMAATWNKDLIFGVGKHIGEECLAEGVHALIGPAMNMKRSPLCGRNFEYFSEDPVLCGKLAAAFTKGIQSVGVAVNMKHFTANNQEEHRLSINEIIDKRTLREIYLRAFEIVVKEADPWTVMVAYNKINGEYCCENAHVLREIMRDEWGYQGLSVTDWGAINDRVAGLKASLDLEMPYSGEANDKKIYDAVKNGELDEKLLDETVERLLRFVFRANAAAKPGYRYDAQLHHEYARQVAAESIVLLKNENKVLPLSKTDNVCFIGEFIEKMHFQGGGSACVTTTMADQLLDCLLNKISDIRYAKGYDLTETSVNETLISEAVQLASNCEKAVIVAGLPEGYESESYDRKDMKLPESHLRLIDAVSQVNSNVIVVLLNGSAVEMDFADNVSAIVEGYLSGQGAAYALTEILFGDVNPSGKLSESFPIKLEDNPSYLNYGGGNYEVIYGERFFVGYRYYEKKKCPVRYPFGHGLNYTTFQYENFNIANTEIKDTDTVTFSIEVCNTGEHAGKEVVQVYVGPEDTLDMPIKTLCAFEKVHLEPKEKKVVSFTLSKRDFAYYNTAIHNWHMKTGKYYIYIGSSSADIRFKEPVFIQSTSNAIPLIHTNTVLEDVLSNEITAEIAREMLQKYAPNISKRPESEIKEAPLRQIMLFSESMLNESVLSDYIERMNAKIKE